MIPAKYILGEELRIQVGRATMVFKRVENIADVYIEVMDSTSKVARFGVDGDAEVEIKPLPLGLTSSYNCIMYKLREPIVILPKSRIRLNIGIPYSIGILVKNTLVTAVEPIRRKLALHGTPTLGELCIYCREEDIDQLYWPPGETPVYIENNGNSPVVFSKFIVPINGLSIYMLNNKIYYGPVNIDFTEQLGKVLMRVSTSREPPLIGAIPVYTGEPRQYVTTT